MSKSSKGEGTKIAQAAKDLNVTSVTIRRYVSEFNIETTVDENGIKVLPMRAMEELHEIRKLKEDGLTNPQVLELLEEKRAKREKGGKKEAEPKKVTAKRVTETAKKETARKPERKTSRAKAAEEAEEEEEEAPAAPVEEEAEEEEPEEKPRRGRGRAPVVAETEEAADEVETEEAPAAEGGTEGRSKHSLTCQTCGKVFEHMNPRLRDCLECYRAKRKERRRGGDKHKNVIQHPLAQQVASKQQQRMAQEDTAGVGTIDVTPSAVPPTVAPTPLRMSSQRINPLSGMKSAPVRNYRKAIEETRQITANLKRRLERPDLPENERRWLEQIYAYQLILHQGWRHLAEYKAGNQGPRDRGEGEAVGVRGGERERGERGDRERGERGDRDRGERGDRDRGDRGDRGERGDRERGDRGRDRGRSHYAGSDDHE